eukprot:SAG31_NODE_4960_length_2834_cov_2.174040_3_plen_137_part_00
MLSFHLSQSTSCLPFGAASTPSCMVVHTWLDSSIGNTPFAAVLFMIEGAAVFSSAIKFVLVEPGDVYLFSGAQAHCAVCVGSEGLSLTAYESFINLHPTHLQTFTRTNDPGLHFEECHAEEEDLECAQGCAWFCKS